MFSNFGSWFGRKKICVQNKYIKLAFGTRKDPRSHKIWVLTKEIKYENLLIKWAIPRHQIVRNVYKKKMELESGLMLKEATSNFDILQHLQCLDKISGKSLIWYCHWDLHRRHLYDQEAFRVPPMVEKPDRTIFNDVNSYSGKSIKYCEAK